MNRNFTGINQTMLSNSYTVLYIYMVPVSEHHPLMVYV